jgi:retinol dehydrogenase-12
LKQSLETTKKNQIGLIFLLITTVGLLSSSFFASFQQLPPETACTEYGTSPENLCTVCGTKVNLKSHQKKEKSEKKTTMNTFFLIAVLLCVVGYVVNKWKLSVVKDMEGFQIDYSQAPGKNVVITGGNQGLGYETAIALAKAKANVILACRNAERCEDAKRKILSEVPSATVSWLELDVSSLRSVQQFVERYVSQFHSIDVLVNNAGISLHDRQLSPDGFEMQMATNHLGHFHLTSLLFPYFNQNGRIINVSSIMHWLVFSSAKSFFENIMSENDYSLAMAYSKTKLANLLFTNEFNRRVRQHPARNPKNVIAVGVHPGFTATNLQNSKFPFWEECNNYVAMKLPHGALTQIYGKGIVGCLCFLYFFF